MERNLRVLGFASSVRAFGLSLIGPFLALYFHNVLGVGFAEVGLIAVAVAVPPLLLTPLAGLASDRWGRRRVFVASLGGEAACLFGLGEAMSRGSFGLVFAGFTAFSIVSNLGGPAVSAYVADFAQGSDRTAGFTWLRVGHNVGFTLGVLVGGSFVGLVGFVPVALAGGAFSAVTAGIAYAWMAPTPYDDDLAQVGGTAVGGGARTRPGSLRTSLRLLARDRVFLTVCLAFGLASIVAGQWAVTFPLFAVDVLHISYAVLGAGLALNGFIVVVAQTAMTRRLLGRPHTGIAVAGTIAYAIGFVVLALGGAFPELLLFAFFAAVLILTLGENLLWIPQSTLPSNVAPATEVGAYNGVFQTVMATGILIATGVGGFALAAITSPLELWILLVAPVVPAVLLLQYAGRRVAPAANRA